MTKLQIQLLNEIKAGKSVLISSGDKNIARSLAKQGVVTLVQTIAIVAGAQVRATAVTLI